MKDHHEHLCDKHFQSVMSDPNHKINNLLPARHNSNYNLRNQRNFNIPRIRIIRIIGTLLSSLCPIKGELKPKIKFDLFERTLKITE